MLLLKSQNLCAFILDKLFENGLYLASGFNLSDEDFHRIFNFLDHILKYYMFKKILLLITVLVIISITYIFIPIVKITITSGKEYFLLDKENIGISIKNQMVDLFKNFGFLDQIELFKNKIRNDSHNINSNSMGEFNPDLLTESESARKKLYNRKSFLLYNSLKKREKQTVINDSVISLNKTSGINNERYYKLVTKELIPKIYKKINIENNDIFQYTNINVECTPLFNNGKLYFPTSYNSLKCIDLFKNNKVIFDLNFLQSPARRGMVIENTKNSSILYFPVSKFICAINASNGKRVQSFGINGYAKIGYSAVAPEIFDNILITSTTDPSSIIALNKINGKIIWRTKLSIDNLVDGASPWSGMVLDRKRRLIFVTTGNPKPPLYGKDRIGKNLHSNSVLAISIDNGNIIWSFQETIHDLWDFDIASAPIITNVVHKNQNKDILIVPTKKGNLIVLDRESGQLLADAYLKRAPVSDVPGEITSPYQLKFIHPMPFLNPPSFDDIRNDYKDLILSKNNLQFGENIPPSLKKETIIFGLHGGATWPGATIDYLNNQIIFNSNRIPWKLLLFLQDNSKSRIIQKEPFQILYKLKCQSCHGDRRNGTYQNVGEYLIKKTPSLVGIKYTNSLIVMSDLKLFKKYHQYTSVNSKDLYNLKKYFEKLDDTLLKNKNINLHYNWSMFYDSNGLPITKPPFGEIVSYNLKNLKINWKIPNGNYSNYKKNNQILTGLPSYGGIASLSNNTFVTTGTPDQYVKIFKSSNGKLIWQYKMNNAGSAPPLIFSYRNNDYLVIVSTGGKFYGYKNKPTNIYIFKY